MRQGEAPDCHCFGQIHSAPAGRGTLARNGVLAALSAVVVIDGPGPSLGSWVSERTAAELVAVGAGSIAIGLAALAVQLWLDRNDLRRQLTDAAGRVSALPAGLPVGTMAPSFSLPDLEGHERTLEELSRPGLPVALFFVSWDCGPCAGLFPELGRWQSTLADRLTVAIVTRGAAQDNRAVAEEQGLTNVLLQEDMEVMTAYRVNATPSALIVSPDGTIASSAVSSLVSIEPLIRLTLRRITSPTAVT
jgi:peroxiredoxin